MNIQERVNRLGDKYTVTNVSPLNVEEAKGQTYSCKTEEDYEKAKKMLSDEEMKIIQELHEEYKDYMQVSLFS